ncbi:hypothetical protein FDB14_18245 [Clostridium botulinum]|nr:hypothetical protein [Clostridium botulinum]NFI02100.1 hypothetical protein [Clostridium botulinum]NFK27586.1 hypothetical protein [Clostridium botulinum]NFK69961.1 hypothetical protein [Clostridium botulinum]NFK98096.1 hypothetical protein [Clostridium botulinum]
MKTFYERYKSDCEDCQYLYNLDQFGFSNDELLRCCTELADKDFVIIEYDKNNDIYLYMTSKIFMIK